MKLSKVPNKNKANKFWRKLLNKIRSTRLLIMPAVIIILAAAFIAPQKIQITKQYAQIVPHGILPVFGVTASTLDSLAANWTSTIRYGGPTAIDLFNKAPVFAGTNSISYTVTAPGDEMHLVAPAALDIGTYSYLTMYVQAGSPGQKLGVSLLGADGQSLPSPAKTVPLDSYGGAAAPGYWTVYNIPIGAFGAPYTVYGIGFTDLNGGTQNIQPPPAIYIDEINFTQTPAEDIPYPSGGVQISAPTTVPTPSLPYYPDISPWIFIVPGIIILLAIIFQ